MKAIRNCACIGGVMAGGAVFIVAGIVTLAALNAVALCYIAMDE